MVFLEDHVERIVSTDTDTLAFNCTAKLLYLLNCTGLSAGYLFRAQKHPNPETTKPASGYPGRALLNESGCWLWTR
jgi:hypothetical protein